MNFVSSNKTVAQAFRGDVGGGVPKTSQIKPTAKVSNI